MKRTVLLCCAGALIACWVPAVAQDAPAVSPVLPASPAPAIAPPPAAQGNAVLRTGTEVPLILLEELTTKGKKLRVGSRFRLETSEPVVVEGVTVVPAGTPAVGEITEVRNKGMWGKSGKFTARLLYLTVNGRQVRLSGGFDDKGRAGGVGAVAVSALAFLPAGFFMTGTSAMLPAGTEVKAFIDEDVPLAIQLQPAVMTVAADASTPAPALSAATSVEPSPGLTDQGD